LNTAPHAARQLSRRAPRWHRREHPRCGCAAGRTSG
jgi:hypothetical protein